MEEGFSQGCPASPVFAAIVLHVILEQLQQELNIRAASRKSNGDNGDDGMGTLALILAYVDDCNALLHHHHNDIPFFLQRFTELATPLGAVLNTEKTRILTATNYASTVDKMLAHEDLAVVMQGKALQQCIKKYSTK